MSESPSNLRAGALLKHTFSTGHARNIWRIAALLLLSVVGTHRAMGATRDIAWLEPPHPRRGELVTVKYRVHDVTSAFSEAHPPMAQLFVFSDFPDDPSALPAPTEVDVPMRLADSLLEGGTPLTVTNARFIVYRFVSEWSADNNNGDLWNAVVVDSNGVPVDRALELRALALMGYASDSTLRMRRNYDAARTDISGELARNPEDVSAWDIYFTLERYRQNGFTLQLTHQMDSMAEHFAATVTDQTAPIVAKWLTARGQYDKLRAFEDGWLAAHAAGQYRLYVEFTRAKSIKSAPDEVAAVANLVNRTKADSGWAVMQARQWLLTYYLQDSNGRGAATVWQLMRDLPASVAVHVAEAFPDSGTGPEEAIAVLEQELERLRDPVSIPHLMALPPQQRPLQQFSEIADVQSALGQRDLLLGHTAKALEHFGGAVFGGHWGDTVAIAGLISILEKQPVVDSLRNMVPVIMVGSYGNAALWPRAEALFEKWKSEDTPPLDFVKTQFARRTENDRRLSFCRNTLHAVAPDWAGTTLQGNDAATAKWLGKVLVYDFWGTWCEPCKITYPTFDSVATLFAADTNVVFVSVATHESCFSADSARAHVAQFMRDIGMSVQLPKFPVVWDSGNVIAGKFDVHFFPTFVIVDAKGVLRFAQFSVPGRDLGEDLFFAATTIERGCDFAPPMPKVPPRPGPNGDRPPLEESPGVPNGPPRGEPIGPH